MFSDEEIKEIPEGGFMRPGDEIISIREVCLGDKFDRKDLGLHLLPSSNKNDLDVSRSLFRDGFFPEGLEQQAKFAWTEEDGNIVSLVSEPGFGTTGQTTFGKQIDSALKSEMKEADTSSSVLQPTNRSKSYGDSQLVSSTSSGNPNSDKFKNTQGACKVDKADPRSRFHFVKYVKRHERTVKLWECGICGREFQHQYTLMRHLPTHTDERNFHCIACGKSFRQLSTLSQHKAIHSAERPYSCEVCNKTFNRVSTLISHRKTHSDEKPYRCHICPKGFHQKGNLRNHLFTHTNERPYRCNICYKGFNQQSNLVCHKNKAHPEDGSGNIIRRNILPRLARSSSEPNLENSRPQNEHCEVSSSADGPIGPLGRSPSWINPSSWEPLTSPKSSTEPWISGVIVDAIHTYHMEVAIATKQTPFALLKPGDGAPVLVKVVDTALPGGKQRLTSNLELSDDVVEGLEWDWLSRNWLPEHTYCQMLVPATAADLRSGGKIVVKKEEGSNDTQDGEAEPELDVEGAVQIRVPVVATVIPRFKPGGRLHLAVEEPHRAFHTALYADLREVNVEPCSLKPLRDLSQPGPSTSARPSESRYVELNSNHAKDVLAGSGISSSCALPPPPPSPPLDLIPMDLFEPMECMPLGPQITAVDNIDEPPPSDDSDIFIGEFEESIPLSDSD